VLRGIDGGQSIGKDLSQNTDSCSASRLADFAIGGSVSRGPDLFICFRKGIRSFGDGVVSGGEAVTRPVEGYEAQAIANCLARLRKPVSEESAA
jgi:hypothetical protein